MNNIHNNSLFAFESIKPVRGKQKVAIYTCIDQRRQITAKQIARVTGISINAVVARLNELVYDHQAIKISGQDKSGRTPCSYYSIRHKHDPLNTRKLTDKEKWDQLETWINGNIGRFINKRELKSIMKRIKEEL